MTWLAMSGLGVDKFMRRAGHDVVETTMGYVDQAEDLTGDLGAPFGPLPRGLIAAASATQTLTAQEDCGEQGIRTIGSFHYT